MTSAIAGYRERMFGSTDRCECGNSAICAKGNNCYYKKAKAALDRAHDIRKFEIDLLWKRATYVATFQTLLFAALGLSFDSGDTKPIISVFQLIVCVAGIFTSFYWRLINKGSKFWHENWTHHIDFLEGEFEGKLHKTVLFDDIKKLPFSVSRVNIEISEVFCIAWFFLLAFVLLNFFTSLKCSILDFLSITDSSSMGVQIFTWTVLIVLVLLVLLGVRKLLCWRHSKLMSNFSDTEPNRAFYWKKRELPLHIDES